MLVTPTSARAVKLRCDLEAARRAGRRAARHHLEGRERPAHDLSVRRRAVAPALHRAVRPVRRRRAVGQASDLRARRRDAAAAAQSAGHGPGVGRRLPEARRGERRGRVRFPRHRLARPRPRHQHRRQPALVRAAAQLRRRRPGAGNISALAQNTPPSASAAGRSRRPADRDCILPLSSWSAPDLGQASSKSRHRSSGHFDPERRPDRHRRPVHRHRARGRAPTSTNIGSSTSRPTAWSPRARPNARRSRRC